MSYSTIAACAADHAFLTRISAACAQEARGTSPETEAYQIRWGIAAKADIEAAYASALAANNPDPGGDDTVVTDGMILSAVQATPVTPATP